MARMASQESWAGVIKSYNGLKGFGFITCADIEGDTFFMRSDLPEDAREVDGKFLEGRSVAFMPSVQQDGRSKAASLELAAVDGELVPGAIKSYSDKNGYGFITSSCFPEGDIRFNRQNFESALLPANQLPGKLVTFMPQALADGKVRATRVNYQNGQMAKQMAAAVQPMPMAMPMWQPDSWQQPTWQPAPVWQAPSWGGKGGNGWGNGSKGMGKSGGGMGKGATLMSGVVKSYSERHQYGFITVPGHPDMKFGKADIFSETIASGAKVSFQAVMSMDGRMQAQQVREVRETSFGGKKRPMTASGKGGYDPPMKMLKGAGGAAVTTKSTNRWVDGQVKSFNVQKGFGFIASDSVDGDVFFMKSDIPAEVNPAILVGTPVSFELMNASNGKMRAQSITMA